MNKRRVYAIPPIENETIKLTKPQTKAAGVTGVIKAISHIHEEIGLVKGFKSLNRMNQKGGFDCSGCAWPDPDNHRSGLGEYCENGAKALAEEATKKRISSEFFKQYSVEELSMKSDMWLGKSGRLTEPMILKEESNHYEPISWENAFSLIATHLNKLNSPDEAVFYTSGRTSNEAAFMYQLFAKEFGTNNLPDCSNMCHESSGVALTETVGIGKGSVTLEDLHKAEVILVIGQNPGTNHPRMLSALKQCKENGGSIVSINPLPETGLVNFVDPQDPLEVLMGGTELSDYFLQIKINEDITLLKCLMKLMLDEEKKVPGSVFDHEFISAKTTGYEALVQSLEAIDVTQLATQTGVPLEQINSVAELLIQKKRIVICWAMGITQHVNGVQNIREIVNLLLLKGSIGIEGGGTCPVRGHSNVQGDRTMGIYEKPSEAFLKAIDSHFNIHSPRKHGYDVVDAIGAMKSEKVNVFIGLGGNFISATPDSERTGEAMQNCDLTVQISTKLNRSHCVTGKTALILPCLARSEQDFQLSGEQFVSVENSMGIVHMSRGVRTPASNKLRSEVAIVAGIAKATLKTSKINWAEMEADYDVIRAHISQVIPGFKNYVAKVRREEGFYLPNTARDTTFKPLNGKAKFTVNEIPNHRVDADECILMTIRTHDQYNTTIYGMDDRYRGILNARRVVLMNVEDMARFKLNRLDIVHITSQYNGVLRKAESFKVVPFPIAKGCVATYFPEANCLVPLDHVAEKSNTPVSKFIRVRFEKVK